MSRILIITGMHRSGTSLVANLFDKAGVHLGAQLLAAKHDNPLGFFEDAEFVQFHEDALHARGQNILVTRDFSFTPSNAERTCAQELITSRAGYDGWGWKDPRTCLFLNFWYDLLPHAQFLFVYRHPFDVILSLARRGEVVGFDFYAGLEAWYAYNAAMFAFAQQHPGATLVCSSYALVQQIDRFNDALNARFGLALTLNEHLRDEVFQSDLLHRTARAASTDALLPQIHPEAFKLYDTLQKSAALPEDNAPPAPSDEMDALCRFAAQLPVPLSKANRRAMLNMLVAISEPDLYEKFSREHVAQTNELENQRRAWEQTAEERTAVIREQNAWAEPRMKYLSTLESNALVRALVRLGILPKE